jgi:hypothetical protein
LTYRDTPGPGVFFFFVTFNFEFFQTPSQTSWQDLAHRTAPSDQDAIACITALVPKLAIHHHLAFVSVSHALTLRVFRFLIEHVGHDSTINIVYPGGPSIYSIRSNSLPYILLTWVAEDAIVAAGHDCCQCFLVAAHLAGRSFGSLDDTTAPKN